MLRGSHTIYLYHGQIITPSLLVVGRDLESPPDAPPKKEEVSLSERFRYQQAFLVSLVTLIFAKLNCLPEVDQGRDTIETKWCRTHIRGQHTQKEMETGKIVDTFSGKRWKDSHSEDPHQKGMKNRLVQKLRCTCTPRRWKNPWNSKEVKYPHNCQRLKTVHHW